MILLKSLPMKTLKKRTSGIKILIKSNLFCAHIKNRIGIANFHEVRKMKKFECSTGIDYLDQLLGELRIGDNVVWETEAGSYVDLFTEKFARHSLSLNHKLIYISFNRSPITMIKRLVGLPNHECITLLDCFTSGKGDNDPTFNKFYEENHPEKIKSVKVENPSDVSHFIRVLNEIEEESGEGTRYVFDSLTGMQDLWGDEIKTYKFFTYACPRLYDLNTVAYWILEKGAHTSSFKANLEHVTQVAIDISNVNAQIFLKIIKAEGRYSPNMLKPQRFDIWGEEIVFHNTADKDILDLGGKIKALRLKKKMTQYELANKINATASYISQVERNIISPSIDAIMLLSNELQVEPGYFFSLDRIGNYSNICHRSQHHPIALDVIKWDAVKCYLLTTSQINHRMQPIIITIEPNSSFSGHFFNHKGDEFLFLLKGELELDIDGKIYTLREGDSIYIDSSMPAGWRNKGEIRAEAIWILSPPGI